jgi:hypothetical protein
MPSASPTSDSIANTGTVAASNVSSFMQAFSADLQAMLTQLGDEANTPTTSPTASTNSATSSCTTASATNPTDPTQSLGEVHHRHHHMHGGGEDQSMDNTANQLVGQIGQSLQGGTLGSGRIRQSASVLAGDVMQALQSYGAMAPGASLPPILA